MTQFLARYTSSQGTFRIPVSLTHVSFFEGLAQVQVEAAASGLPIITTTASGGEEIVEEGKTGFLIEPGNIGQLIESISQFVRCPTLAAEMRDYMRKRSLSLSWSAYGDRWQKILEEHAQ